MNEQTVQAEYERLGYGAGWAFAMTPTANMGTSNVVLVGLNPGGSEGRPAWEFTPGNAYLDEVWTRDGSPMSIQTEVRELLELLSVEGDEVFAAQFIPFRNPNIKALAHYDEALAFSRRLWTWVLAQTPARLFVCMGQDAAWQIAALIGAVFDGEHASGWGATVVRRYVALDGRVVVSIPHPSWYKLLGPGRDPAEQRAAKLAILQAARPVTPGPTAPSEKVEALTPPTQPEAVDAPASLASSSELMTVPALIHSEEPAEMQDDHKQNLFSRALHGLGDGAKAVAEGAGKGREAAVAAVIGTVGVADPAILKALRKSGGTAHDLLADKDRQRFVAKALHNTARLW